MENTVLYLEYYLMLREEKYSHEAAKLSAIRFMEDQLPANGPDDFHRTVWLNSVKRVIDYVNRIIEVRKEEE